MSETAKVSLHTNKHGTISSPTSRETHRYRSWAILLSKFLFVGGLIYFLIQKGFISVSATREALSHWEIILPAVVGLFCTMFLGAVRWQWLLRAQNIELPFSRTLQLTLIGNFFNIALPGAVSGDFVKAFYIGKELQGKRTKAFGSILFDRVAGVSALVVVSAGALLLRINSYWNSPLVGAIKYLILIAAFCVVLFYGYLFLVREKHDVLLILLKKIESRFVFLGSVTRIYESLRHYHHHRGAVLKVLAISSVIHLTVGWSCLHFAQSLNQMDVSLLSIYIVVPLGLLITAVPIAPAGVGTGNLAFLYFFHLIGSERGADVYSLLALTNILIGMVGGIVYLRFRSSHPAPPALEAA